MQPNPSDWLSVNGQTYDAKPIPKSTIRRILTEAYKCKSEKERNELARQILKKRTKIPADIIDSLSEAKVISMFKQILGMWQ